MGAELNRDDPLEMFVMRGISVGFLCDVIAGQGPHGVILASASAEQIEAVIAALIDQYGKLEKPDLDAAMRAAGLAVPD